ncbi:hypothetical protein Esti_002617 [Eimeria stiedai]
MASTLKWRAATVVIFAALLVVCAVTPSLASEGPEKQAASAAPVGASASAAASPEDASASAAASPEDASASAAASPEDASASEGDKGEDWSALDQLTSGGILEKMKNFPLLGEQGASLLQLAEEGLGFNASNMELSKIVPMLAELQKNIHDHYMVTKGNYQPSSLLKRVVSRKSQSKVLKSMKKFAPNTDDGELMQQLDAVTHVLHKLHTNPQTNMQDILHSVSGALGLDLEDEDMQKLTTHMQWAQSLMQKVLPFFSKAFSGSPKAEDL